MTFRGQSQEPSLPSHRVSPGIRLGLSSLTAGALDTEPAEGQYDTLQDHCIEGNYHIVPLLGQKIDIRAALVVYLSSSRVGGTRMTHAREAEDSCQELFLSLSTTWALGNQTQTLVQGTELRQ